MKTSKLLLLGMLIVAMCMSVPAMGVSATGTVDPDSVPNDGASVLHFTWDISAWVGTANYYTFDVREALGTTPIYIQYSDTAGTDDFPGISVTLQNVNGTVGGAAVHLRQPEYGGTPGTHDWTVPATLPAGNYEAWARLYIVGGTQAGAYIPFSIAQAVGSLEVTKFVQNVPDGITMDFDVTVTGPSYPGGITHSFYLTGGAIDPPNPWLLDDLIPGDYYVTEADYTPVWTTVISGDDPAVVTANSTASVTVTNTYVTGSLQVTKVVQNVPDGITMDFDVTVTGPSFPGGITHTFYLTGGAIDPPNPWVLDDLIPGNYYVTEADYTPDWTTVISGDDPAVVTVSGTASVTVTNTYVTFGDEGCTPGFWKNNADKHNSSAWCSAYGKNDLFEATFGIDIDYLRGKGQNKNYNPTLLDALGANGGGINALARHATAALLNACSPCVNYVTNEPQDIIDAVQDAIDEGEEAIQDLHHDFAYFNESGCPVNQHGDCSHPI